MHEIDYQDLKINPMTMIAKEWLLITAGNEASTTLHEKFGFEYCGKITEVGVKFGRYLDIENYRITV